MFAGELFRMYAKYAERQGWKLDMMSSSDTGVGVGGLSGRMATSAPSRDQMRTPSSDDPVAIMPELDTATDRKSTRLNSSH